MANQTSSAFNITPGALDHISYSVQPSNAGATASNSPAIKVEFRDANENLVSSTANVTLAINNNPGTSTLSGTLIQAAVAGVATFSDISLDKVGTAYTLDASTSGQTTITSSAFNITGGAIDHISFNVQPTNTAAAVSVSPSITVEFRDAGDNLVTSTANITLSINNNPGTSTLSGTLIQAAVGGVATFNDISLNKVGTGYTLDADTSGQTTVTSAAFNIVAGAVDHISYSVQPSNAAAAVSNSPAIKVEFRDAGDNLVTINCKCHTCD